MKSATEKKERSRKKKKKEKLATACAFVIIILNRGGEKKKEDGLSLRLINRTGGVCRPKGGSPLIVFSIEERKKKKDPFLHNITN